MTILAGTKILSGQTVSVSKCHFEKTDLFIFFTNRNRRGNRNGNGNPHHSAIIAPKQLTRSFVFPLFYFQVADADTAPVADTTTGHAAAVESRICRGGGYGKLAPAGIVALTSHPSDSSHVCSFSSSYTHFQAVDANTAAVADTQKIWVPRAAAM